MEECIVLSEYARLTCKRCRINKEGLAMMTHQNALCQEEYELVLAQIKQRLSHKILESQNRSLAVLRAKAWLSINHKTPNNLLSFNDYKLKKKKN